MHERVSRVIQSVRRRLAVNTPLVNYFVSVGTSLNHVNKVHAGNESS